MTGQLAPVSTVQRTGQSGNAEGVLPEAATQSVWQNPSKAVQ